jgi:hypothetical protein
VIIRIIEIDNRQFASPAGGSPINAEVGLLTGMGASFLKNMPSLLPSWYDAQLANKNIKKIAGSIFILAS